MRSGNLGGNLQWEGCITCTIHRRLDSWSNWDHAASRLDKVVEVCNKSVATLESRLPISARLLCDLKATAEDVEIDEIEPMERTALALQPAVAAECI